MFLCMFIQGGVCQTAGLFFVIFLEVFDESRGYVALITSVNFGVNKIPYTSDRAKDHGKESDPKVGHAV